MKRINILYLHSHDTGRYLQPYGYAVPARNLQQLAEQGVLFRQAYSAAPTCSPSRASLLTGRWAHCAGMTGLAHRGFELYPSDHSRHLVQILNKAGYHTALSGEQHEAADVTRIGYRELLTATGARCSVQTAGAARAFLLRPESRSRPFFLSVGFYETHRKFPESPGGSDRYTRPPAPIPDTQVTRMDMAGFVESARRLDEYVGMVLGALDESGLANETLVIYTTDHGPAFPLMKGNLTDHGIGVSMIWRGPNGWCGGKVVDAMVSQIDVFPTLCELTHIEPPAWLQGKSLMPLVRAPSVLEVRDELFAEVNYHAAYEPQRCVRTQRWKYIRRYDGRTRVVLPNCDKSASKSLWLQAGWQDRPQRDEMLFDLMFDPLEMHNLIDEPIIATPLMEMRARLNRWMHETDDPLLRGAVPLPAGARIDDPDTHDVEPL